MKITAVIAAGGSGTRMRADRNKLLLKIRGREIISFTIAAFENNKNIDDIIIAASERDEDDIRDIVEKYGFGKVKHIVRGGTSRQSSVLNGLRAARGDIVLIHDGARALVTDGEIDASINDCIRFGAAAAGVKCKDTLKSARGGFIADTIDREKTYMIQTPQTFYLSKILELHERAASEHLDATDDCMIAERYGVKVKISEGSYDNIKLTTPIDMIVAEKILERRGVI